VTGCVVQAYRVGKHACPAAHCPCRSVSVWQLQRRPRGRSWKPSPAPCTDCTSNKQVTDSWQLECSGKGPVFCWHHAVRTLPLQRYPHWAAEAIFCRSSNWLWGLYFEGNLLDGVHVLPTVTKRAPPLLSNSDCMYRARQQVAMLAWCRHNPGESCGMPTLQH